MSLSLAYCLPFRCCFNRDSHIELQQTSQCRRCELVHYHATEALRVSAFLVTCSSMLHVAHVVHWHNMCLWPWNLWEIVCHYNSLTVPKDHHHNLAWWWGNLEFLWRGRSDMLPYHTLPFCLWIKVMDPRLILHHFSVKKSLWFSLQATKKISTNIDANFLLLFS